MIDLRITLTTNERLDAFWLAQDILYLGKVDINHPLYVRWCETHKQESSLLSYSTTFPSWLLMSLQDAKV